MPTPTHRCETCDTPVEVARVDTTTQADFAGGVRTFAWGRHTQCAGCGSTARPRLVIDDANILTQPTAGKPRCPRCGSERWVSVSLDDGWTRRAQCVPCGTYHAPVIGPGHRSPKWGDPEAEHPLYREERAVTQSDQS